MKNRIVYLILPIVTLVLEFLPYGAVCNFANPEGSPWRKTFSYFDLTPFGYANFSPFITAMITCVIFALLTIYCITGKNKLAIIARNVLLVCTCVSLCPLLLGVSYFSIVGAMITLSLIAETFLIYFFIKSDKVN